MSLQRALSVAGLRATGGAFLPSGQPQQQQLLSKDQKSQIRWPPSAGVTEEVAAVQMPLFSSVQPVFIATKRRSPARLPTDTEVLLVEFRRRAQALGCSEKTARDYSSQLRTLCCLAESETGEPVNLIQLFGDAPILGKTLACDSSPNRHREYSGYSTDGRRHAARKFAVVFSHEIADEHGAEGEVLLDRALRTVYRRVGTTYRSPTPRPRNRGARAASPEEIERVLEALASQPGFEGLRERAAVIVMVETGCRVNSLRLLRSEDCFLELDDQLRILLRSKGRRGPAEYLLSKRASSACLQYFEAFNEWAAKCGREAIRPGEAGMVWRSRRGIVTYKSWRDALAASSALAGLPRLKPHDLRRTFATQAESRLERHFVALAGWWDGTVTMDRHYINPRPKTVERKAYGQEESRYEAPRSRWPDAVAHGRA